MSDVLPIRGHLPTDYAVMHPCPDCGKRIPPDWTRCAVCENAMERAGEDLGANDPARGPQ